MNQKPLILVIGATGAQGGSVAHHLLISQEFRVRALTRNPDSEKAKNMQQAGTEIVAGDMDDKESLLVALQDCNGVYGVTNFWEHFDREYEQGMNLVDAVVQSGVKQFVMSTLPSVTNISNGTLSVPHFDIKAQLEEYARSKKPDTSFVHLAFYYENFLFGIKPQKEADGSYIFGFPQGDAPMAAVSIKDLGGLLLPVFQNPEKFAGKTIETVGDFLTGDGYAEVMSKVSGKDIHYRYIPREQYASLPFPGAEEMSNMFEYYRIYVPYGKAGLEKSRELYPDVKSFEQYLTEEKEAFIALL